ncbi:myb/sant-like dna-binding domain [Holotrichia oblita]|uniref:Myb/sant-like dna-binding domain n=1 Tax=Holotrichia oblita TaxID=644536 RepID=A0ACB9THT8_HOLOL|nr:myb/sant-like dna-binding domain [Holotrichia oblita]
MEGNRGKRMLELALSSINNENVAEKIVEEVNSMPAVSDEIVETDAFEQYDDSDKDKDFDPNEELCNTSDTSTENIDNFITAECKRTDTDNNRKKTDTWKAIEKEFNSLSGQTFRDVNVLKNKYEHIKKRTKKKVSDNKINIMGTGGGPSQDAELTDIDNTIIGMLGARVEGYSSGFGTITFALIVEVDKSFLNENVSMEVPSTSSSNFTASTSNLPQAIGTVNEIETSKKPAADWSTYTSDFRKRCFKKDSILASFKN